MGDDEVGVPGERLLDDGLHRVDGEQHPADGGLRVAADEADGVPVTGPGRVVHRLEDADDLGERRRL